MEGAVQNEATRLGGIFLAMEMTPEEIIDSLSDYVEARRKEDNTFNMLVVTGKDDQQMSELCPGSSSFLLNHYLNMSQGRLVDILEGFKSEVVFETVEMIKKKQQEASTEYQEANQ